MTNNYPNKNEVIPNLDIPSVWYVKNLIEDERIQIGDYTYFDCVTTKEEFMNCLQHFYSFSKDKLIIGKFCQIVQNQDYYKLREKINA